MTYRVIEALAAKYRDAGGVRIVVQNTGDLLTPAIVRELLDRGVWMISVAGVDDFHVGMEGADRQAAFKAGLGRVFVDGKEWAAELDGGGDLAPKSKVHVLEILGGARLKVRAE